MKTTPIRLTQYILSVVIALFVVSFLWGFWEKGPGALGVNMSICSFLLVFLAYLSLPQNTVLSVKNWEWIIPLCFLCVSFALYENPFFKLVSALIVPLLLSFFFINAIYGREDDREWQLSRVWRVSMRSVSLVQGAFRALYDIFNRIPFFTREQTIQYRVLRALLFSILSLSFAIPLLMSADPRFEEFMHPIIDIFYPILESLSVQKIIVCIIVFSALLGAVATWTIPFSSSHHEETKSLDPMLCTMVLSVLSCLYTFFIALQFSRYGASSLPNNFIEAVTVVKQGFWQLLTLSVLNGLLVMRFQAPLNKMVMIVLRIFTLLSCVLTMIATFRVFLYAYTYGLSYEKLYASYTALFCLMMSLACVMSVWRVRRLDLLKFFTFQFLFMFSFVSIIPAESLIARANMYLLFQNDSHVNVNELTMLSLDAYPTLQNVFHTHNCHVQINESVIENEIVNESALCAQFERSLWNKWFEEREAELYKKEWYEHTLSSLIAKDSAEPNALTSK